jgi:hypothetical protein
MGYHLHLKALNGNADKFGTKPILVTLTGGLANFYLGIGVIAGEQENSNKTDRNSLPVLLPLRSDCGIMTSA